MFYLNDMCCLCLNNKIDLRKMSEVYYGKLSYYNKIIICIPQMIFTELNNEKCVCKSCCDFVDEMYGFRDVCLRNGYILKNYISKLRSVSSQHGDISVNLNDFKNYVVGNETVQTKEIIDESKQLSYSNKIDQKNSASHFGNNQNVKRVNQNKNASRSSNRNRNVIHLKNNTNHNNVIRSKNKNVTHPKKKNVNRSRNKNGNRSRNKNSNRSRNRKVNNTKNNSVNTTESTDSTDLDKPSTFTEEQFSKFEELSTDLKRPEKKDEKMDSPLHPENAIFTKDVTIENETIENEITIKNEVTIETEVMTEDELMNNQLKDELMTNQQDEIKTECMTEENKNDIKNENELKIEHQLQTLGVSEITKTENTKNNTKKIYKCQHCSKICSTSYNFVKHFKTHKKKMPFKCSVCKKCFIFSKDLVKHLKNHITDETSINK